MIKELGKHKAKFIVDIGTRKDRRRRTKTVTYTGPRDLKKQYDAFEAKVKAEIRSGIKVPELLDSYIRRCELLGAEATTVRGYNVSARRVKKHFEGVSAADLTTYQVEDFVVAMAEKYASKTIANTIGLLSAAYERAIRTGQLSNNPCKNVKLPKAEQKEVDIFTEDQIAKFLKALDSETLDYQVAFKLALFCGLRRSEILGLREIHVNVPFKTVTVVETRHRVNRKTVTQGTKTTRSHRTLALPDSLARDIGRLIDEHHDLDFEHTDYLIQDGFGKPLNPSTFSNKIYRVEDKAGLPHVSLHDLRHTFASLLNSEHVDIARISRELGHSNIATTLGIYTHVFNGTSESSRGIADIIEQKCDTFVTPKENKKAVDA